MPEHIYQKDDLIQRFDAILGKKFEEIDNKGIFEHFQEVDLQKGIAGTVIEQCVLGYPPDSNQKADLIVVSGQGQKETELKTTGMLISEGHYVAKEPMSITAVGVHEISNQTFESSHFLNKIQHMLIVYYEYIKSKGKKVSAYDYKDFPVKGYEFHEFSEDELEGLKVDWQYVHDLCEEVVNRHSGPHDKQWFKDVKNDYIKVHGVLRRLLTYVNLAPTYPPRFRLKQPIVSDMVAKHFGQDLEQLPGSYIVLNDVDRKCRELTRIYGNKTIGELSDLLSIRSVLERSNDNKAIAEQVIIKLFGGNASSLNQIELFVKFGLVAKSIVITPSGKRTEDMKLFKIDFDELTRDSIEEVDDAGNISTRPIEFEDSDLYSYFSDHEFLCIIFEEPEKEYERDENGKKVEVKHPLSMNKFIRFERLVFSDEFINTKVRYLWEDTRNKVMNHLLVDVPRFKKDGSPIINSDGHQSSAPNFLKCKQNDVFLRGSGNDGSISSKTEVVNGINMLPQYCWIKGSSVVADLESQRNETS